MITFFNTILCGIQIKVAFTKIEETFLSNKVLVHYNPNFVLTVVRDASPIDLRTLLSHKIPDGSEKPTVLASSTLNVYEKNWAQINKDDLALVFAIKYSLQFVYEREFILMTDHKTFVSIFGEKKGVLHISHRLQRYAIFLSGLTYKGVVNGNDFVLSR